MSDPSGPDSDNPEAPEHVDPPTEVIDTGEPADEEPDGDDERRYSAPSAYDVKSTEIIHTPPEPATEVLAKPENSDSSAAAGSLKNATPQAIPPRKGKHRSWGLVLGLVLLMVVVVAVLAAAAIYGTIWLTHKSSSKSSPEDQVRDTIGDFDTAIQKGDLAELRGITCGTTRDKYVNYRDEEWAAAYPRIAAAKQYPVVASIDQVVVNDKHAEANVTTFMAYDPQVRSTRSFDLQYLDDRWKICDGPVA